MMMLKVEEIECEGMGWIHLAQNRVQWQCFIYLFIYSLFNGSEYIALNGGMINL
jgi:hypothetical protein